MKSKAAKWQLLSRFAQYPLPWVLTDAAHLQAWFPKKGVILSLSPLNEESSPIALGPWR